MPEEQKKRLLLLDCKDIGELLYHLGKKEKFNGKEIEHEIGILLRLNKN